MGAAPARRRAGDTPAGAKADAAATRPERGVRVNRMGWDAMDREGRDSSAA